MANIKNSTINEMDFKLDNFENQKIYTGALAIAHKIKNLFFLRPGDMPSLPKAGINIQSYRFKFIDTLLSGQLREDISDQISTYITDVPAENVAITVIQKDGDYILIIGIVLYQSNTEIVYGLQQRKGELVNFNFKIYDNEKVKIW